MTTCLLNTLNNTSVPIDQFGCNPFVDFFSLGKAGQYQVRHLIDDDSGLTASSKRVLLYVTALIGRRRLYAFPRLARIALKLSLSTRTIRRALSLLAARRWIHYEPGAGFRLNRIYLLRDRIAQVLDTPQPSPPNPSPPDTCAPSDGRETRTACPLDIKSPNEKKQLSSCSELKEALEPFGEIDDKAIQIVIRKARDAKPAISTSEIIQAAVEIAKTQRWERLAPYLMASISSWLKSPKRQPKTATVYRNDAETALEAFIEPVGPPDTLAPSDRPPAPSYEPHFGPRPGDQPFGGIADLIPDDLLERIKEKAKRGFVKLW